MRGERRQHFERDFQESTIIGSRLLSETGTSLAASYARTATQGRGGHQPLLRAAKTDYGGALRVVQCIGLRPGSTLQGMRGRFEMVSQSVYGIHSPCPIYVTGCYLVKASQLPDQFMNVFSDTDRSATATLPASGSFVSQCFRNVFNDNFATYEHMIVDEDSQETQALLPEIIQTMEVVGDDELNLTYDEWVYLVTGWYPKNNKSQRIFSRARKAGLAFTTMLADGADQNAPVQAYGHFAAVHDFSYQKNIIAVEPSFLLFVAGLWEQPNSQSIYGITTGTGITQSRFAGANAAANVLDRGAPHAVDLLRHSESWLADPTSTDIIGDLSDRATINYFLGGEVRFTRDLDPSVLTASGSGGTANLERTVEATEGAEAFLTNVNFHIGISELQHFPE